MKKTSLTIFIVLVLVIGIALGFYFGQMQGEKRAEDKLGALIDRAYPPPPEEMHVISGVVKEVRGGTIELEVIDPDDYLPHPDGSPKKTESRFASFSSDTELVFIDHTSLQSDGWPTVSPYSFDKLKQGDTVKVTSEQNIRDAKKFDVTRVEVIRY